MACNVVRGVLSSSQLQELWDAYAELRESVPLVPIFNPGGRRRQMEVPQHHVAAQLAQSILSISRHGRHRHVAQCSFLHSEAGCKAQQLHTDWDPKKVSFGRHIRVPMSMLVAMQDNTLLITLHHGTVTLNTGDACFFDATCVHGGAAYIDNCNTRFFAYIASDMWRTPPQDETYIFQARRRRTK